MRRSFLSFFFAMFLAIITLANAEGEIVSEGEFYISTLTGVRFIHPDDSVADFDVDFGYFVGMGFGYDMQGLRPEFEVSYSNNSVDSISFAGVDLDSGVDFSSFDVSYWSFLGKVYYDFDLGLGNNSFTPFIGVASGFTRAKGSAVNRDGVSGSITDNLFTYGGMAGFRVPVGDAISIGAEYNFLGYDFDDPDFSSGAVLRLYFKL